MNNPVKLPPMAHNTIILRQKLFFYIEHNFQGWTQTPPRPYVIICVCGEGQVFRLCLGKLLGEGIANIVVIQKLVVYSLV